jgi:two-component system chemotaxis response regulator CheB
MDWSRAVPLRDIVVVGASAGGVEALTQFVTALPRTLPAAIFIVLHVAPAGGSQLPDILTRKGRLPARHPVDEEPIACGQIYVAPPDRHLMIGLGFVRVVQGPRENRHRPAADPLFRSAARTYGERVIGVVLSGGLDDGTAGLIAVKRAGGLAVVQDPQDATVPSMPQSAIEHVQIDHVVPAAALGPLIARLVGRGEGRVGLVTPGTGKEVRATTDEINGGDDDVPSVDDRLRHPSPIACPECGGVLWEVDQEDVLRFRCRVGHAYSAESLLEAQREGIEASLWSAVRALEEKAQLSRRIAQRAIDSHRPHAAQRFEEQVRDMEQHANMLRRLLAVLN